MTQNSFLSVSYSQELAQRYRQNIQPLRLRMLLSRAAKHHATKHNLSGDAFTNPGNAATFLLKVGGVVKDYSKTW